MGRWVFESPGRGSAGGGDLRVEHPRVTTDSRPGLEVLRPAGPVLSVTERDSHAYTDDAPSPGRKTLDA